MNPQPFNAKTMPHQYEPPSNAAKARNFADRFHSQPRRDEVKRTVHDIITKVENIARLGHYNIRTMFHCSEAIIPDVVKSLESQGFRVTALDLPITVYLIDWSTAET